MGTMIRGSSHSASEMRVPTTWSLRVRETQSVFAKRLTQSTKHFQASIIATAQKHPAKKILSSKDRRK